MSLMESIIRHQTIETGFSFFFHQMHFTQTKSDEADYDDDVLRVKITYLAVIWSAFDSIN